MREKTKTKLRVDVIISVVALVFTFYTWFINERRYNESQKEEKARKENETRQFDLLQVTTQTRLNKYKTLIHTKREIEFFDLYKKLNDLIADSTENIDNLFKEMISNHTSKLQLWIGRINKEELKTTLEKLNDENNELLEKNKLLYTALCTKLHFTHEAKFFEGAYFY